MARGKEINGIPTSQDLFEAGFAYLEGRINLIPVNARKTPAAPPLPYQKWKKYQKERVTKDLLRKWANSPGVLDHNPLKEAERPRCQGNATYQEEGIRILTPAQLQAF